MSPLGSPCKFIIQIDDFIFCSVYSKRPKECVNHDFPSRYCPVGAMTLGINEISEIHKRVDRGYELLENGAANIKESAPQPTTAALCSEEHSKATS